MNLRGLCLYVSLGLPLGVVGPVAAESNEALAALTDRYWDASMEHDPTWATSLGDNRFNDRLADVSAEGQRRWRAVLDSLLHDLRKLRGVRLSQEDRLTHDLLERAIRDAHLRTECRFEYTALEPLFGPHIQLPLILVSQPFRDKGDFRAYVARLRAFPRQVTDTIANLRTGIRYGWVAPRVIIEKVIPQIRTHIVRDVSDSVFHGPVAKVEILEEAERRAVAAEIERAIAADVVPAYLQLLAFVEDEYLPAGRSTVGLSAVTDGDRVYEVLAYLHATVKVAPEEIHELGLAEVARIRGEMVKVQKEVGFEGSLDDFLRHMRTDPRQRFNSSAELYARARAILERTKPLMKELLGRRPAADCVMKELESFRAASSPMAYYNIPPEDGSRPGYFYINTYRPKERLRFTLEALTYHEAVPGHHIQYALDQENTALPKFRRYASYSAYSEGWALYAEKLGYEIGGYPDPYSRFGQLTFEMWRAGRLVVDTGLHMKGWSRQQAVDYLAANSSLAMLEIEAEVDRYIVWPGQALAYKIGELRVLQLRREAEKALKDRFDLRAFHDALLAGGAMPIDLLEQRVHEWVAGQIR